MKCRRKRTLFDIFEIYSCENCEYYKKDEEFYIGKVKITIIYAELNCPFYDKGIIDKDSLIENSKKVRLFLKDAIISNMLEKNILLIWIDEFNLEQYENIIDVLIGFEMNIFILTNF